MGGAFLFRMFPMPTKDESLQRAFAHFDVFKHHHISETGWLTELQSLHSHAGIHLSDHDDKGRAMHDMWKRAFTSMVHESKHKHNGLVVYPIFHKAILEDGF